MSIPGLFYQDGIVPPEFEQEIISWLDQQIWSNKLSRRTQQYGYEYNYSSKKLDSNPAPSIAGPLKRIADWLNSVGIMNPTQCIVNEYTRDQGINAHTDSPQFGPTIVSISLLSPCNMEFKRGNESVTKTLMPRSCLILSGESRSYWTHRIPDRKTVDMPDGTTYRKLENYRRVSLTFRTLAN